MEPSPVPAQRFCRVWRRRNETEWSEGKAVESGGLPFVAARAALILFCTSGWECGVLGRSGEGGGASCRPGAEHSRPEVRLIFPVFVPEPVSPVFRSGTERNGARASPGSAVFAGSGDGGMKRSAAQEKLANQAHPGGRPPSGRAPAVPAAWRFPLG